MITFRNVTKQFGESFAIEEMTFSIRPAEFVFLVGHSGAGKTTIARLLTRELLPTSGQIQVGEFEYHNIRNREIPILRRQIGVVYQDFKLLHDRTAEENIALVLEIMGKKKRVIEATVKELLKVTGLESKGHLFPSQLSGGETQRVVIARALASEPAVIFADEPTGNLDDDTAEQIVELLVRINQEGTAVIMSTHNKQYVEELKKRMILVSQGKIIQDTDPYEVVETEIKQGDNVEPDNKTDNSILKKPKKKVKQNEIDENIEGVIDGLNIEDLVDNEKINKES